MMNHESGEEMLVDVIGAGFLMLDLMGQEPPGPMPDPTAY